MLAYPRNRVRHVRASVGRDANQPEDRREGQSFRLFDYSKALLPESGALPYCSWRRPGNTILATDLDPRTVRES